MILQVDLIPASLALAWKDYFTSRFPKGLEVVYFSSCPSYNVVGLLSQPGLKFRRLRGRISMVTEGARQIYDACARLIKPGSTVDLQPWKEKIEGNSAADDVSDSKTESSDAILTIGMIGQALFLCTI